MASAAAETSRVDASRNTTVALPHVSPETVAQEALLCADNMAPAPPTRAPPAATTVTCRRTAPTAAPAAPASPLRRVSRVLALAHAAPPTRGRAHQRKRHPQSLAAGAARKRPRPCPAASPRAVLQSPRAVANTLALRLAPPSPRCAPSSPAPAVPPAGVTPSRYPASLEAHTTYFSRPSTRPPPRVRSV
ncbi:hypothetical protein AB1Y20_017543 [Prymnesium parvum]|uniref:Uncharacterized protein n=1 Tax=Prymnesium parvum TaxID=97485 RepID=A0AB34JLJ8_PRYPA